MNEQWTNNNVDTAEIEKFSRFEEEWWNPNGELKTLHDINPIRLDFICMNDNIENKRVIDVGCGGGILTEALSRVGAQVTGIDMAERSLEVARLHAQKSKLTIDYRKISAEELADSLPETFDSVICMEMLEHVPDPQAIINACARLVKPNGKVFFSTLNRNAKSYLHAIVAAEYILNMLPRGTHDFKKFITPAELSRMARMSGLTPIAFSGMKYQPLWRNYILCDNTDVNYLACFTKEITNK